MVRARVLWVVILLFAGGMSLYTVIGALFEEHDLAEQHGDSYRAYMARTGRVFPRVF